MRKRMPTGEAAVGVFVGQVSSQRGALTVRGAQPLRSTRLSIQPPLAAPASVSLVVLSVRTCLSHSGGKRVPLESPSRVA